jgi:magnesium transporter
MISRHKYRGGVWIDLEQATEEEVREITREFSIGERIETELLYPTPSPLVAGDAGMALLVLHFPTHGSKDGETNSQEIDFVVGQHFIVTVRYEVIVPLHHLKKMLETDESLGHPSFTTDVLLEILFAHLYTAVRDHANHASAHLARIERDIFSGRERTSVLTISNISREFLHLESALASLAEPLSRFLKTLVRYNLFGPTFGERAERMLAEHEQVARLVEKYRAVATELRETNKTLLEVRQNEIIKLLTVFTVLILPLELVAGILKIHANGTPLLDHPHAFWIIIAIMLGMVGAMTLFFAKKRWIF